MELKNELKSYFVIAGVKMSIIAESLGISKSALSQKINNESLRYKDAVEIARLLGYEIIWKKKE